MATIKKFIGLALILFPVSSWALSIEPMILEMGSGPTGRSAQISVTNDSANPVPVEVDIVEIHLAENGEATRTPARRDFTVFPSQQLIPPGGKQVFRLQWAGAVLEKSRTYMVLINQLAVKMPKATSGVQLVYNMEVAVNVAPPSGTASLDLVSAGVVRQGDKLFPTLLLSNSGNVHAKLSEATVTLRSGSWSKVFAPGDLTRSMGIGIVQPGKRRRFVIPFALPAGSGQLSAEISYRKAMR